MVTATQVSTAPVGPLLGQVVLKFEDRYRRRIQLTMTDGQAFLLHLAEVCQLDHGAFLVCEQGCIEIVGAQERVLEVRVATPAQLASVAWHLGNRHLPLQILPPDGLRIAYDKVIMEMLEGLETQPHEAMAIFAPEGGAYGGGPTYGHS